MKILIATNNEHKISEIKKIINEKELYIEFITLRELELNVNPAETADTFEGNAEIKARAFYNAAKIPVIADDSGLEVASLNGMPGVHSARFASFDENILINLNDIDRHNRHKLLKLLENTTNRDARFRSVIAFYNGKDMQFFEGVCNGKIAYEEHGEHGFGYDSIFIPDGYNVTFAQMSDEEKNQISHRANAIHNFIIRLKKTMAVNIS